MKRCQIEALTGKELTALGHGILTDKSPLYCHRKDIFCKNAPNCRRNRKIIVRQMKPNEVEIGKIFEIDFNMALRSCEICGNLYYPWYFRSEINQYGISSDYYWFACCEKCQQKKEIEVTS